MSADGERSYEAAKELSGAGASDAPREQNRPSTGRGNEWTSAGARLLNPPEAHHGAARAVVGQGALSAYRLFQRARNKCFSELAAGAFAAYGKNSMIELPVRLMGEHRIAIGSRVFLGAGCWLRANPEGQSVVLEIGDGTSAVGACVLSAEMSVKIGADVLIARNVYIADHMHAFERVDVPILDQGVARTAPVEIGSGAWLGQNVVVGPGVRIGKGAAVGSNSVVLNDVPDYSVAAGAPARVFRTFDEGPSE